jgi:Zn-dependent protease
MALTQFTYNLSIALIPVLLGMILHEIAHGWVAFKMGDPTAKALGRLTLNPLPHLDPLGTLFFVITAFVSRASGTPFIFGWARPIPIDPRRFRSFRQGMFLVSIAGASANLLLALLFSFLTKFVLIFIRVPMHRALGGESFLLDMCVMGVYINCTLAWFNLMPVPPLDGSKVLVSVMPAPLARAYLRIERYGMIIVLLLFVTNLLPKVMLPLVRGTALFFGRIVDFIF